MDKRGAGITCPTREEVVVLISIKEMYVGVLENYLSVIVVEYISIDVTARMGCVKKEVQKRKQCLDPIDSAYRIRILS
jgi:hypothetical protein